MKIRIFYSETLKEQIYLDYFFAMDGGSGGFFKDDPNDKSILSRFRKEAWDRNRHIKKDCSYYLKKQRKWFVDDFKRAAWNYCNFLEQQDLDDLYRYGRRFTSVFLSLLLNTAIWYKMGKSGKPRLPVFLRIRKPGRLGRFL